MPRTSAAKSPAYVPPPIVDAPAPSAAALTPAMRQYLEQKAAVPDAILLFRIGDFYETFFDDAKTIARVLGLTLTARDRNASNPIPLAGVPYHAVDGYVARLVRAGYKVAISEQMEDPKSAKGVIKRDIVRIITPGTLTDDRLLEATNPNWLAAIFTDEKQTSRNALIGLAAVELASGRYFAQMIPPKLLLDELARLRPAEVLTVEQPIDRPDPLADEIRTTLKAAITPRGPHAFDTHESNRLLCAHFGVAGLAGFGFDGVDASIRAAGALLEYLQRTQKTALQHILKIEPRRTDSFLALDHATLRALEIEQTARDGSRQGSLLSAIDRTVTTMGARRLRDWLCFPLREPAEIRRRQDAIADLRADRLRLTKLRDLLREMRDIERIAARLGVSRANPRDLLALGQTIISFAELRQTITTGSLVPTVLLLADCADATSGLDDLAAYLASALRDDAPPVARDGGFIAPGFNAELDRLRTLDSDAQRWLAEYQAAEIARTNIPSLKVGYNEVFGYYIEITNAHKDKVPPDYVRRQTVRNAERFITDALKKHETEVLTARERSVQLEVDLFDQLCKRIAQDLARLQSAAVAIATLDVLTALADLSLHRDYCRPELVEVAAGAPAARARRADCILEITDGRHPVLEQTLSEKFVPNDCHLSPDGQRVLLITGPNMAGKSTYIRQTALLLLLAQTGSYVPARAMKFAPADRIFARVGAADEIARGHSTFMVEMVETARILNSASAASLVILDEIGRGTSTFDGLALAWAITEHIARRLGCRTLFATHYHELTELAASCPGVANYNVAVQETRRPDGSAADVIFLHRIVPGGTDKSYGIHVARMAGIPPTVVARSVEVLAELEQSFALESKRVAGAKSDPEQPTLFPAAPPPPAWWQALADELKRINLDATTPIDALNLLRDLQNRLHESS